MTRANRGALATVRDTRRDSDGEESGDRGDRGDMAVDISTGPAVGDGWAVEHPRLRPGTRLIGPYEGCGFQEPRFLASRPDHQVVHLPRLLFLVLESIDGERALPEVAERVSAGYGRRLTVDGLKHVLATKLAPLGLIDAPGGPTTSRAPRAAPLLALRLHGVLLPASAVRVVARLLSPLYAPVVVGAVLVAGVALDVWLLLGQDLTVALRDVTLQPVLLLVVLGLLLTSTLFHECGHAAGCHYGGGRPGVIGVGLYLVVPAFYTNVTDAYRLGRRARLRTDLGGIYFNTVFIVASGTAYALTGYAPLLVVIALTHLEILQQLVPIVRLDGYFILADLVGVPDLFGRIRPVLLSLRPGGPVHPAAQELRPRVRAVVTAWVLLVVPLLAAAFGLLLWRIPELVASTVESSRLQGAILRAAVSQGQHATAALALVSLLLLALPMVGLLLLTGHLVARGAGRLAAPLTVAITPRHAGRRSWRDAMEIFEPAERTVPEHVPRPLHPGALSADSFDEETYLRRRYRPPTHGWRRLLYAVTRGRINVGPGRAERRETELVGRVRNPIRGARRIVVLSRKGGAGKTTTALMLGHTFAQQRGDRVVALDANPDAGSLAHRIPRETTATVTTLLSDQDLIDRYSDIRGYTSQAPTRLEVIASDDDPRISQALGEADYHRVIDMLDRHYNLILLDTGTGILDDAIQGILKEADQIVLVLPPALDGARVAAATLDWLEQHGYSWLVRGAVTVINAVTGGGQLELERVEDHFAQRCAATVRIPWDPMLEAGAQTSLADLKPATRAAYLRLAAAVADAFQQPSDRAARP